MPVAIRQLFVRHGWLCAIFAIYLYAFPYFPRIHSANELPRAYLVQAIVEDHTFAIDRQVRELGATADVSPYDGHQYSNKAPGSSLLVVPFYAVVRWIHGTPSLAATMWLCRIVGGVVPAVLFLWLLWGFLARFADEPVRRLAIVAYALGSMAMTYAILFYSHQLAAVCIASAWILALDVIDRRRGLVAMLAVGALAGAAPLVDYQAAFAGVPIAVYVIVRLAQTRLAELGLAVAYVMGGAAVPIAILFAYHWACFGSPTRTGYDVSQTFAVYHQHGFLGITALRWQAFYGSLLSADNGLVTLAPWWLLAIPGGVVLWRRGERGLVIASAAVAVVLVLFVSSINFWRGGWGVGPRYITAMQPFLLPLVAAALDAWRGRPLAIGAAAGLVVPAVVIYCASAATFPYWPDSVGNPLYDITFRLLRDGAVAPNLGAACGISGLLGLVPYVALVGGLVGWTIVRASSGRGLALALALGAVILAAFALVPHGGAAAEHAYSVVRPAVAAW
ncbi:MAG TPA: hypothetical protein VLX92_26120 [Kofleriaceae bacterium]|nr:hypothetical protein [Kofleriaceae bacterium]